MFANLYLGEFKKNFSWTTTIIFVVIFVVGMAVVTPLFEPLYGVVTDIATQDDIGFVESEDIYTEDSVNASLDALNAALAQVQKEKKEEGYDFYRSDSDLEIYYKNEISKLEYIKENKLYGKTLATYTGGYGVTGSGVKGVTDIAYIHQAFGIFYLLVLIYALVVAAGVYPSEYKARTVKLLFLRPITRDRVTTAKLLYVLTNVTVAYIIMSLSIVTIGCSVFEHMRVDTIFSFNGGAFTVQNSSASIPILMALYYIPVVVTAIISFALSTMTRKTSIGIVIPIVVHALGTIITYTGLSRFFIADAMDFMQYAGISTAVTAGGNFFISLPVLMVYLAGLLAGTYLCISKKDVA